MSKSVETLNISIEKSFNYIRPILIFFSDPFKNFDRAIWHIRIYIQFAIKKYKRLKKLFRLSIEKLNFCSKKFIFLHNYVEIIAKITVIENNSCYCFQISLWVIFLLFFLIFQHNYQLYYLTSLETRYATKISSALYFR